MTLTDNEIIEMNDLCSALVDGTLADIDKPIDLVDVFRRAEATAPHADEAVAVGAGALWLQLGIVSAESRRIAEAASLDYVEDLCTAVVHRYELR